MCLNEMLHSYECNPKSETLVKVKLKLTKHKIKVFHITLLPIKIQHEDIPFEFFESTIFELMIKKSLMLNFNCNIVIRLQRVYEFLTWSYK